MSSKAIRDAFRTELGTAFPAVPVIETFGVEVDNEALPSLWMGIGFAALTEEQLTIEQGQNWWAEVGLVRIRVAGNSGDGDAVVMTQADAVREHFRYWKSDGITLQFTLPPGEENPESDGKWVFADVDLQYTREFLV